MEIPDCVFPKFSRFCRRTTPILSKDAPRGTYTYSGLSVSNEGQNESAAHPPVSVTIP
jgi:hypothetical protein